MKGKAQNPVMEIAKMAIFILGFGSNMYNAIGTELPMNVPSRWLTRNIRICFVVSRFSLPLSGKNQSIRRLTCVRISTNDLDMKNHNLDFG